LQVYVDPQTAGFLNEKEMILEIISTKTQNLNLSGLDHYTGLQKYGMLKVNFELYIRLQSQRSVNVGG